VWQKLQTTNENDVSRYLLSVTVSRADVWQKLQTTNENGETESSFRMTIKQVKTDQGLTAKHEC